MKLFGWLGQRKKDVEQRHDARDYCHDSKIDQQIDPRPDPELVHARSRLAELERIADERTMAGIEWERDLQMRKP